MLLILRKLCAPTYLFFIVTAIFIAATMIANADNTHKFKLADYEWNVSHVMWIFTAEIIHLAIGTFILQSLCRYGCKCAAWLLSMLAVSSLVAATMVLTFGGKNFIDNQIMQFRGLVVTTTKDIEHSV